MSRLSGLSRSSIPATVNGKGSVLFYVNDRYLDTLRIFFKDQECLLPVHSSLGITGLSNVHEVTTFKATQDTP